MEVTFLGVAVFMLLVKSSGGSCTDDGIDTAKVATMCTDSVVTGTSTVYVDTSIAGSMSLASGVVCSCSVQTQAGKVVSVTSSFAGVPDSDCGTTVQYDTNGITGSLQNVTCNTNQLDVTSHNLNIHFKKNNAPYESDYCIGIQLVFCNDTEFQCNDGACINKADRCNALPDCDDHSDEDNCDSNPCPEGQVQCAYGATCILSTQICDGNEDCPGATDEPASCGALTTDSAVQTTPPSTPQIIVTCTESIFTPTRTPTTASSTTAYNTAGPGNTEVTPDDDDGSNDVTYIVVGVIGGIFILAVGVAYVLYRKRLFCFKNCSH